MMKKLLGIAKIHFQLSQKSWIWFPFNFLRPRQNELITHKAVLLMSVCFGSYFYFFYLMRELLFGQLQFFDIFKVQSFVLFVLAFFVWFEVFTRPLWNLWVQNRDMS
jgi:hypothetical protein